jgi:hypothetical protein
VLSADRCWFAACSGLLHEDRHRQVNLEVRITASPLAFAAT